MENFIFSVSVVLPLFLLIALGYFLRRIEVFTADYVAMTSKACFRVFMPVMLFVSIVSRRDEIRGELITVQFVAIASIVLIVLFMIVVPILEKDNFKRGAIVQALYRSNTILFGVPLVTNIYGTAGLAPMAVVIATVVPLYNTAAVLIFAFFGNLDKNFIEMLKKIAKDLATNPLIISSVLAIMLIVFNIRLPLVMERTLDSLAVIAPALALLALGGGFKIKKAFGNMKYIIPITIQKMLINPIAVVVIAVALGFEGPRLAAVMVLFSAPVAVSSQVFAQEMGSDGELTGQVTVVTSMVSCLTIFGFIYVLNMLNLL